MIIAGLDIATKSGLAVVTSDDRWATATFKPPKKTGQVFDDDRESTIDPIFSGQVGRAWEDYLHAFLLEQGVTHCGIEMPLRSNAKKTIKTVDTGAAWAGQAIRREVKDLTSMSTIYRLYGMNFIACSVCARLGIPTVLINQTEHRKAFLGNGSPKDAKQAAVEQCRRLGIHISSVDAAEAVGVAWATRGILMPAKFKAANDLFSKLPPTGGSVATATA